MSQDVKPTHRISRLMNRFIKIWARYSHKVKAIILYMVHRLSLQLHLDRVRHEDSSKNIIVIAKIVHFGDIVACEPVAETVKQKNPNAYIIWCVSREYRELIDSNPAIDFTLSVSCLTEWIFFSRSNLFDEIIDLHIDQRVCHLCQIPLNKPNGSHGVTFDNYYRFGSLLSIFSRCAGITISDQTPKVYISKPIIEKINRIKLPENYVAVHCTSHEICRNWTDERWINLVSFIISEMKIDIVEVGLVPVLGKYYSTRYHNLCGKLKLLETAEVIRRAGLFIGVDSGPAHMANAVGTKGVILQGQYRTFDQYMPYSGRYADPLFATIIHGKGPVSEIPVDEVKQAILNKLTKSPSGNGYIKQQSSDPANTHPILAD